MKELKDEQERMFVDEIVFVWNPVKELKDQHLKYRSARPEFLVESGEGIERPPRNLTRNNLSDLLWNPVKELKAGRRRAPLCWLLHDGGIR